MKKWLKGILFVVIGIAVLSAVFGGEEETASDAEGKEVNLEEKEYKPEEEEKEKPKEEPKEEKKEEPKEPEMTLAQENAIGSAESYLSTMPFSKEGLVEQLKFDGFSQADADFAVNNIEVDWNEQAVKSAQSYLDTMTFSRSGLIDQLTFDGFSNEQATYAVDQIGL